MRRTDSHSRKGIFNAPRSVNPNSNANLCDKSEHNRVAIDAIKIIARCVFKFPRRKYRSLLLRYIALTRLLIYQWLFLRSERRIDSYMKHDHARSQMTSRRAWNLMIKVRVPHRVCTHVVGIFRLSWYGNLYTLQSHREIVFSMRK